MTARAKAALPTRRPDGSTVAPLEMIMSMSARPPSTSPASWKISRGLPRAKKIT